uniref:Uncharacterized protein n=1 Tax=Meloidogyne enterolobii TaxID=390850 RepID=A0A6V7UJZ7_MELEN|nr:unnamed protein product [Meloidogyne enterolobii]
MIFFVLHLFTNFRLSSKSVLILMKILIFIILIFIIIVFLLHYTGSFDAECRSDIDCEQYKTCQPICRLQCKSTICTIVGDVETSDKGVDTFVQRRKLYHRPIVKSEEEPFDTIGNPFASEALLRSHPPMPEKRDLVTHLTISESELEAELKQHLEPEKSGLGSFVTAPTVFNDAKLTIGTSVAHGKRSPGVDDITLTMSRELLSEDIHLQRDVVSSPAFNPQPPGFTPTPKIQTGTTGVTEQYPLNSLESFENIDDEKKDCDNENCDGQSKTTTTFWPITTKALKTTKIHQQKMQFLKGLSRTTQRVPSHGSWTPLGKPQTMQRTTLKSCDSPPICGRNCGVVIDPNGCQSCDCLWRSKNCRSDIECRSLDGQICDFGRCECGTSYT